METPLQYFGALLHSLREVYGYLSRLRFEIPDRRMSIVEVIGRMSGMGLRQLEACRLCIEQGYVVESFAFVRTVWEIAIDAGFMLDSSGKDRIELCERYFAMEYLRTPIRKFFESDPPSVSPSALEDYKFAMERHGGDETVFDLRAHWSGRDKGKVRDIGGSYIDERFGGSTMFAATKQFLFRPASLASHADPGMNRLTPHDERGWPRSGPVLDRPEVMLVPASTAGTMLLAVVSQRGSTAMKSHANRMIERCYYMIREHVGIVDNAKEESTQ